MPGILEDAHRQFRDRFGSRGPIEVARACGRINLIGEHLDYNGLPVLPMALDRGITLVFRRRADERIRLVNLDRSHAPIDDSFREVRSLPLRGDWSDLVRVAKQALSRHCGEVCGFDGVLTSDLPRAAGLSSSTALVVAVAKALISVNGLRVDDVALIELLAEAERQVGAPGGAMDQAACIAGAPRTALKVEFDPLRLTSIPVPEGWVFVVAHSLVEADKSGPAAEACRARVSECAEALAALRRAGVAGASSYATLVRAHPYEELLDAAGDLLSPDLTRRLRHVVTESQRVQGAEQALGRSDIAAFGRLMRRSQSSLREDFAVSHPAVDRLAEIAQANGAVGARLTGAGFGGCIIALCAGSSASVLDALRRDYYAKHAPSCDLRQFLFQA